MNIEQIKEKLKNIPGIENIPEYHLDFLNDKKDYIIDRFGDELLIILEEYKLEKIDFSVFKTAKDRFECEVIPNIFRVERQYREERRKQLKTKRERERILIGLRKYG